MVEFVATTNNMIQTFNSGTKLIQQQVQLKSEMDCWKKVGYFQYFVLSKNFLINEINYNSR